MTTPEQIGWGSYQQYEGPFFRGKTPYRIPERPSEAEKVLVVFAATQSDDPKVLAVIAATEGGHYDAINMYDRCVVSVGIIQWCEAGQYSVSNLLGVIAERDRALLAPLEPALAASSAELKKNNKGRYRFFFKDERGEVDTLEEQRQLFFGGASGERGSWDDASKAHAKRWAACLANTLSQPAAQEAQIDYTLPKLQRFALPEAVEALFSDDLPSEGWVGAMRAGFLSFAANLPAVANSQLKKALKTATASKWSPDWCGALFRQLTFGPRIAIYPRRYQAIRPVLERLYGVELPDFNGEHATAQQEAGGPGLDTVEAIQKELIAEGYDLGPAGADGKMGNKTRLSVMTFQRLHGLTADGIVGPKTREALAAEARKRGA